VTAAVSIVLPTYNRAAFLPEALAAVRAQTFIDWELIVIDDGSTDDTGEVVGRLTAGWQQAVRYIRQPNRGPAAARNAGIDHADGRYVAFYDSDDLWLPHHLAVCVEGLEANPDVDWVCAAMRLEDQVSGRVIQPTTFRTRAGRPIPFIRLPARTAGALRVVEDPRFLRVIVEAHGEMGNLQASVFRRRVFDRLRLPAFRVGEDQAFLPMFLKAGFRLAYIDAVHVVYRVHGGHASSPTGVGALEKRVRVQEELIRALASIGTACRLSSAEAKALDRRLARELYWNLGYSLLWQNGHRAKALEAFRRGLRLQPWNVGYWKTYLLACVRMLLRRGPAPAPAPAPAG
jgi:glycosyltransferase involved in cell wall biosynthesis